MLRRLTPLVEPTNELLSLAFPCVLPLQHISSCLPYASYLHSTRRLRFLRCERNGAGRIDFVFDDPDSEGELLRVDFEAGAECPAANFYDSVRHLRRVMDGTRSNRNIRTLDHEHIH